MFTLVAAPDNSVEMSNPIASVLQKRLGRVGSVRIADLDGALKEITHTDTVILIHGEPTKPLLSFVDQFKSLGRQAPILVWGAPEDSEIVSEYLMLGAKGCFLDGDDPDSLIEALNAVRDGGHFLPPTVQNLLLDRFVTICKEATSVPYGIPSDPDGLTDREHEVLELLVAGYTNPEIADRLFLETGTVKNHVHHILKKLNVRNRDAAARYYETRKRFSA